MVYSPWGRKELDMTEQLSLSSSLFVTLICSTFASLAECDKILSHGLKELPMDHPPGKRLVRSPDKSGHPFGRKE